MDRLTQMLDKAVGDDKTLSSAIDRLPRLVAQKEWQETKVDRRFREHLSEVRLAAMRESARRLATLPRTELQRNAAVKNVRKAHVLRATNGPTEAQILSLENIQAANRINLTEKQLACRQENIKKVQATNASNGPTEKQTASARVNVRKAHDGTAEKQRLKDADYLKRHGQHALDKYVAKRAKNREWAMADYHGRRARGLKQVRRDGKRIWIKEDATKTDT